MERIFKIAKVLIESEKPLTIDAIANSIHVSNKTIRNSFSDLEEVLAKYNLSLSKKQGVGVAIEGTNEDKLALLSNGKFEKYVEPYSPEHRKNYILKKLFISDHTLTIKELSEELYVSRVTVHNDLEAVEEWLNNLNLKLIRKTNYGIEVIGEEETLRNAVASLIVQTAKEEELKELLQEENNSRIDYKTLSKLKELVNLDYKQMERIVGNAEDRMKFIFSDDAYVSFIIHLAILIERIKHNKDITLPGDVMEELEKKEEYVIAKEIASNIEEVFKVSIPKAEIGYILFHILGAKMQQNKEEIIDVNFSKNIEGELAGIMAKEIIEIVEQMLRVNLAEDKQFFNGLILHLNPIINRIKYGLTLRNPILDEIKRDYPEVFGVAWMTSSVFQKYMGIRINEEEIGYIALHIAAAVERNKKPLKTLVVCTSGIGTSQLLAIKLEKHFQQIEIKKVSSIVEIKKNSLEDIDIIISTVPVEINKPTIFISPLLNENDIKRLGNFISDIYEKKNTRKHKLNFLFNEEFIEIKADYKSKEELIRSVGAKLYDKGYIKREYITEVLKRESQISTEVGKQIAIPHASTEFVNQSALAVVILEKPIKWKEDMVNIVFFTCISKSDLNKATIAFRNLYRKIDSEEFINDLKKMTTSKNLIEYLEGVINAN